MQFSYVTSKYVYLACTVGLASLSSRGCSARHAACGDSAAAFHSAAMQRNDRAAATDPPRSLHRFNVDDINGTSSRP